MTPAIIIEVIGSLVLLMAGFFILVRYLETAGVFFPSQKILITPDIMSLPFEDIYFKSQDEIVLNGWLFKNPKARSTLIFAHGNAGNMSDRLFKVKFFYDLGLNVFIFDYRGYGKSAGKPTEAGIYLDAQGAYDYLQGRADMRQWPIVLYGASLGGAVVIDLATHRKIDLLVVESSFSNARDMARILYPFVPSFCVSLKFNSLEKVATIKAPKLFIHSPEDKIVPFYLGEKLFKAARDPKEFLTIHGGHHDGSMTSQPLAAGAFVQLLKAKGLL